MEEAITWVPPEVWGAPPQDWYKLNFDGSFHHQNQLAGIEGIVRNSSEDMAVASYAAVEAHNALEAEIKAIIRGVWICVDLNLGNILTERDSYIYNLKHPSYWWYSLMELDEWLEKFE